MSVPVSASPAPRGGLVVLALLLVYVVWGSTYLGIRLALESGLPPLSVISGLRFVIAGSVLYGVLRWRGVPAPTRTQWPTLAVMGFALLFLGNGMVVMAERDVSSGLAAVAVASVPLWMALFSAFRGQPIGRGEWLGIAIGFAGVLWLNAGSSLTSTPRGLVFLLIAPLGWAAGSIWSKGRDLPSPFMAAAAQMLCGGAVLMTVGLLGGERVHGWPSLQGVLSVGYLSVFGSIVGFTAYVWLLQNVRPVLASSYAYVNPVIAVALGAWLASERFSGADIGAMVVILAGVVVITLARVRRA
ncbi:drug/metabolite exporter YedA [Stenotrophomonas sp. YIM B06876]|uniref:drug/metabolite exporter YedA n=1 Tax=Stenotrophomonas sp. YIM B06876 TaxID=3060211 RepID=UPI00273896A9|nr:drug/metabolite exporter YedA [Stenotrophomonas sp. YIM B06876]